MKLKKLCIMMAVTVLAGTLSACSGGSGGDSNGKTKLRIGYFPNITHAQALVIKDQGRLEEVLGDNTEVSWTSFNAGPAEIESMFAGEIDLGYIGPIPAISAYTGSNGDVTIVSNASNGGAVLVARTGVDLNGIEDLDGKNIAIPQLGNTQHISLLNLLYEKNLKPTSEGGTVNVIPVANADVMQLMDQGDLDAALVPEPWGTILEEGIDAKVILDYKDIWMDGDYSVAVVICSNDFKKAHPDVLEKFLEIHKDATLFINDNTDEAKTIMNHQIEEATGKAIDINVLDNAVSRLIITEELNRQSIFDFAEISKTAGFIDTIPGEDIIDATYVKQVDK